MLRRIKKEEVHMLQLNFPSKKLRGKREKPGSEDGLGMHFGRLRTLDAEIRE